MTIAPRLEAAELVPLPVRRTRVSFVVPVYNEAATIAQVIERVTTLPIDANVVVIDDGSVDGSASIAESALPPGIGRVVRQANGGKGSAIRAAVPYVDGDIVVIQDADLEYDPADIPRLIEPIVSGHADVVYGSRLSGGQPQRAYMFWHKVGNRFLSLVTNILFNTTLSDMETGYKAFRTDVFRALELRQNDFAIEPEITAQVCLRKLRIYEVPIAYYGRTYDEGKKITWRDGFKALRVLVLWRLRGLPRTA